MYSKQLKVGLLLLYLDVASKVMCTLMHIFLHPVTVFLALALTTTTAPGFLPRVYNRRKPGCRPFSYYSCSLSTELGVYSVSDSCEIGTLHFRIFQH